MRGVQAEDYRNLERESSSVARWLDANRPELLIDAVVFQRESERGLSLAVGASSTAGTDCDVVLFPTDRDPAWLVSSGVHHEQGEWRDSAELLLDYLDGRVAVVSLHAADGRLIVSLFAKAQDSAKLRDRRYLAQRFDRLPLFSKPSKDTALVKVRSFNGELNADVRPQ